MAKNIKIPQLPYGQGTINLRPDGETLIYKKTVLGKRVSVYGESVNDVMDKMRVLENDMLNANEAAKRKKVQITLAEAMYEWLETYKKPKLKQTSYETLEKTIRTRIDETDIGGVRLSEVDSDMLQKHITNLNEEYEFSYSIIKKCYDALNDFFRNSHMRGKVSSNPMLTVEMPSKENIKKAIKEIEFLDAQDIEAFEEEAVKLHKNGVPKYQYGICLCANIYMGLRCGELIALRWEDVDFDNNTVYVHSNMQLVNNSAYNYDKPNEMKLKGIAKKTYIEQSIKTNQERMIPMNDKAKEFLLLQKSISKYTKDKDFVCCTRDGEHSTIKYLSDNIEDIEIAANTIVRAHGTHVIRHTCASLYFRSGVRIELIASLLGHSVEVCRKTYIHFVEEQKKEAVKQINDFNLKTDSVQTIMRLVNSLKDNQSVIVKNKEGRLLWSSTVLDLRNDCIYDLNKEVIEYKVISDDMIEIHI